MTMHIGYELFCTDMTTLKWTWHVTNS